MGNSKQARFNRIGSSGHNPNNYIHIHMMNAPATTISRTFRSGFSFSSGRYPSIQNNHRFMFRTITPDIRRQLYETGGKTRKSMEPPPPAFEDEWVKFFYAYDPANNLTTANDLSINDLYFLDMSVNAFDFSWNNADETKRVFTIVEGTPYHENASSESNKAIDFCGNTLDSSFIVPDQPLAFRLKFNPTSFKNPNEHHFVPSASAPATYGIKTSVRFSDNTISDLSYHITASLGATQNQFVDISLGATILNNKTLLPKLQKGNFKIETHVTQRNKYSNAYEIDKDTDGKNIVEFSNDVSKGMFVYTPPYLITDFSLIDLSNNATNNVADDFKGQTLTTKTLATKNNLENFRYPDLSGLLFVDSSYAVNRLTVTYNHSFPSNMHEDWIHKIQYNQTQDDINWKDVSNIQILNDGQFNKVRFDIFGNTNPKYETDPAKILNSGLNYKHMFLKTSLKIPPTCKAVNNGIGLVSFTMDMSANSIVAFKDGVKTVTFYYLGKSVKLYSS